MGMIKIGNASFNGDEIKKMSFERFNKLYKGKIQGGGKTMEEIYELASGNKVNKKIETNDEAPTENKIEAPEFKKEKKKKKFEND